MKKNQIFRVSIRCYYKTNKVTHYQEMTLKDIPKWIEAYKFTHPDASAISVKVTFTEPSKIED